ncbi:MAG: energy transducer TonB [Myxococcota bacterium]
MGLSVALHAALCFGGTARQDPAPPRQSRPAPTVRAAVFAPPPAPETPPQKLTPLDAPRISGVLAGPPPLPVRAPAPAAAVAAAGAAPAGRPARRRSAARKPARLEPATGETTAAQAADGEVATRDLAQQTAPALDALEGLGAADAEAGLAHTGAANEPAAAGGEAGPTGGPHAAAGSDETSPPEISRWLTTVRARVASAVRYPRIARRAGLEGVVKVRFRVDARGAVSDTSLVSCAPGEPLCADALRTVREASPLPAPPGTWPPQRSLELPVRYRLDA